MTIPQKKVCTYFRKPCTMILKEVKKWNYSEVSPLSRITFRLKKNARLSSDQRTKSRGTIQENDLENRWFLIDESVWGHRHDPESSSILAPRQPYMVTPSISCQLVRPISGRWWHQDLRDSSEDPRCRVAMTQACLCCGHASLLLFVSLSAARSACWQAWCNFWQFVSEQLTQDSICGTSERSVGFTRRLVWIRSQIFRCNDYI